MILSTHGIVGSQILQVDPDYLAFVNRVTTAGGSLSATEQSAVLQLVKDLKDYGIWTKMKAIYPMVGASAAACSQNLKSSSFTGTFTATGWTFASTGVTPNGISAFMDTNLNAFNNLTNGDFHLSFYSTTNNSTNAFSSEILMARSFTANGWIAARVCNKTSGIAGVTFGNDNTEIVYASSTTAGFIIGTEVSNSIRKAFKNNSLLGTNTNSSSTNFLNSNMVLCGFQGVGFSYNTCVFSSFGDGLTDTEASDFYTAVQAFQTTLSRNV